MSLRRFIQRTRLLIEHGLHETRAGSPWSATPVLQATQLEDRLLFSASPVAAVAVEALALVPEVADAAQSESTGLTDQQLLDVVADSVLPPSRSFTDMPSAATGSDADVRHLELVIIDSAIDAPDQLIEALQADAADDPSRVLEFITLDADRDGVAQITSALLRYDGIDGLHIISHGNPGSIRLGSAELSLTTLETYRSAIHAWRYAFSGEADILFYGCRVSESDAGRDLLAEISAITTADVAASDDLTGQNALGGDWELEFESGLVQTTVVANEAVQQRWAGLLDITTGLEARYRFDTDASDSTTNNYDGTLTSGAAIDTTAGTNKIGGGKLVLDGIDDYVDLSAHASSFQALTQGTISLWVNPNAAESDVLFEASDRGDIDSRIALIRDPGGELAFFIRDGSTVLLDVRTSASLLPLNTWTHIAVTVNSSGNAIYVNGTQVSSGSLTYFTGSAATNRFFDDVMNLDFASFGVDRFNSTAFGQYFGGYIDEGRIYSRALTAADIAELHQFGTGTITVTTASDTSDGDTSSLSTLISNQGADGFISLREAITAANNTTNLATGPDRIHFNINGGGPHTITLTSALPSITDAVIIDASTESGWAVGSLQIIVDGNNIAADGLVLTTTADGSTIRGLVIRDFSGDGIHINSGSTGHTISGNFIGRLTATGDDAGAGEENGGAGVNIVGANVVVGGSTSADRNVISGNARHGIMVNGGSANRISGNYIGTNANGSMAIANALSGIIVSAGNATVIGTDADGSNDASEGNVISGNADNGVQIWGNITATMIRGNLIGLNATGTAALANGTQGIQFGNGANNNMIGGTAASTRNVVSGNTLAGIEVTGLTSVGNSIIGNYVGTDVTGATAVGNGNHGVLIRGGASGNVIGGSTVAERNVISGNTGNGVRIADEGSDGTIIRGNLIGVNATGSATLTNSSDGIHITGGADDTTIGGSGASDGNWIVATNGSAIDISGTSSGTIIQGNRIGTDATGTLDWGSRFAGITANSGAQDTTIGGTAAGEGNVIAFSGRDISSPSAISILSSAGNGFTIVGNSIYGQLGIGIDLGADGVTPNDTLDGDSGPNNSQNYPVITSATTDGSQVVLSGTVNTLASATGLVLHFYATPSTGNVNRRDGRRYLGSTTVNTDASGNASFTGVTFSSNVAVGELITATATSSGANGSTSEFSQSTVATAVSGNSGPTGLQAVASSGGGLSLNTSGNDAYLVTNSGGLVLGARTQFTLEVQFSSTQVMSNGESATLVSYAAPAGSDNEVRLAFVRTATTTELELTINGLPVTAVGFDASALFDGQQHTVSVSWHNASGVSIFSVDGSPIVSIAGIRPGYTLAADGILTIGADQDVPGGGFERSQIFKGTLHDIRVFNDVRTTTEIQSGNAATLPDNSSGLVANWRFNDLSTAGVTTDSVVGLDLTVGHATGSGFTSSTPHLTLSTSETTANGTVIGRVEGTDIDREAAISAVLATDSRLRYSAETGKFYRLTPGNITWGVALSGATSATLNGVAGQLVTIANGSENELVADFVATFANAAWLGYSDQTTEGTWQKYSGSTAGVTVWQGNSSGYRVDGAWSRWGAGEPNDSGGEDVAEIFANSNHGLWNDLPMAASSGGYIVEWDADAVLDAVQPLTYAIASQSVAGAFAIDADTGVLTVLDASLLDYEAAASHTLTVRISDGSATYDRTFTVTLRDVVIEPSIIVPPAQSVAENTALVFSNANGNAVMVSDQSSLLNSRLQITLSVTSGSLTLAQTTGLTFIAGANGAASMTIAGAENELNAAMNGLTFAPNAGFSGSVLLQATAAIAVALEGQYTFDDGTANDTSAGTAQNGTLVGNASTVSDPVRGTVLQLDGNGDFVSIASTFGNPASVTIGGWVNLYPASGRAEFISLDDRVHIALDEASGGVKGSIQTGASSWLDLDSHRFIAGTGWHHVMYVFDDANNVHTLYLDGLLAASATNTNSIYWTGATTTFIGQHPSGLNDLSGRVDDMRIYGRALTGAEVAALAAGEFSDGDAVTINVTPANDAPVLDNTGSMTLTGITEDDMTSAGQSVASIIASAGGDRITDADPGAVEGIAITGLSSGNGTWEFSTTGGASWSAIGSVSPSAALLLRDSDLIRFVPNGISGTTNNITFTAWDQTIGAPGSTADASSGGGKTPFSTSSEIATITVSDINDEESLTTNTGTTLTEGSLGNVITTAMLEATDPDNSAFALVYTLTTVPTQGTLRLSGVGLSLNDTFRQDDINNGRVTYDHSGSETSSDWFSISVDDGSGTASTGTFAISVTAKNDNAPIVTSNGGGATAAVSISENSTTVTTVTASDADLPAQTITYSIVGGADAALFAIESSSGALTLISGRDAERPTDSDTNGVYDVVVRASDGTLADDQTIHVTVTDTNELPVTAPVDSDATPNAVAENSITGTGVGIVASASDSDATNNTVLYTLTDSASGRFAIDANSGFVTVADGTLLDRESAASHNISVRAVSADGSTADTVFSISLLDVNEFSVTPVFDADPAVDSVAEDASTGTSVGFTARATDADATTNTVTYMLDDSAGGRFSIESVTGVVRVAAALDYETATSHTIIVRATSADGSTATQSVTISVTDVSESGASSITDTDAAADTIAENSVSGSNSGITAFATDSDPTDSISYSLDDSAGGQFSIDSVTGVVTTLAAFDREAASSWTIIVRATSTDTSFTTRSFTVAVGDVNEFTVSAPADSDPAVNAVNENAANGTPVGLTANAIDADATMNLVTYSLTDSAGGRFAIDGTTGAVTVASSALLDFETTPTHSITVRATSTDGSFADSVFVIAVGNVDEPPALLNASLTLSEGATITLTGSDFTATDSDTVASGLVWTISGLSGGQFERATLPGTPITSFTQSEIDSGAIRFVHAGGEAGPTFSAAVTDGTSTTGPVSGSVSFTNVNDTPNISNAAFTIAENSGSGFAVGSLPLTDPDAGDPFTWTITAGNSSGAFAIDATTGAITVALSGPLDFEITPSFALTVRVQDAAGDFDTATVAVSLTDANDAPVGGSDTFLVVQYTSLFVSAPGVLANDGDQDLNSLMAQLVAGPVNGLLTLQADGSFSYTPGGSYFRLDSFTYRVFDGTTFSAPVTVTLDVRTATVGSGGSSGDGDADTGDPGSDAGGGLDDGGFDSIDGGDGDDSNSSDSDSGSPHPMAGPGGVRGSALDGRSRGAATPAFVMEPVNNPLDDGTSLLQVLLFGAGPAEAAGSGASRSEHAQGGTSQPDDVLRGFRAGLEPVEAIVSAGLFSLRDLNTPATPDAEGLTDLFMSNMAIGSTTVVGTSLTMGYVIWILRGGSLLAAFVSALPAWQSLDPLPVLQSFERRGKEDDESLLSLVRRRTAGVLRKAARI